MNENKIIKVIHINTPYQIVLNCGSDDGIKFSDMFLIYGLGSVMTDPDTNEVFERLEIVRGKGKVSHLQNKICTVDSVLTDERPKTIKRVKNNNPIAFYGGSTEETEIIREKREFDEVQIGDRARKV